MSKVYFMPIDSYNETEKIVKASEALLNKVVKEENVKLNNFIPIKTHFGEKGNVTYMTPDKLQGVFNFVDNNKIKSSFIETNVLYRGERMTSERHKKLAVDHGFTQYPIIIADGDHGEDYVEVEIDKKQYKTCKIGTEILKYNQMLVAAHFKGHIIAGFGGAVKQLAMGCASRGGKLAQHDNAKLVIKDSKCISCKECFNECPVDAITIPDTAIINDEKCIGCASCMAVCPTGAIRNTWAAGLDKEFVERLAEYAYAAAKGKNNIYILFAFNITEMCDCEGQEMVPIAPDIGILASTDPVSIDKACLDLVQKKVNKDLFAMGEGALIHGASIGLGEIDYELIEIEG